MTSPARRMPLAGSGEIFNWNKVEPDKDTNSASLYDQSIQSASVGKKFPKLKLLFLLI